MRPLPIKDNPGAVPGQRNEQRKEPSRAPRPAAPLPLPLPVSPSPFPSRFRKSRVPGALWGFWAGPREVR
ncbi:hypothetical protein QF026_004589 [Streptomyces aurantiacus]|nr:hypothetical protein [Streptomyces aurantiacus]